VKVGEMPHWIALTPDAKAAYVTNENSNSVSVVDLGSHTVSATIPVGNAPRKIVILPAASGQAAVRALGATGSGGQAGRGSNHALLVSLLFAATALAAACILAWRAADAKAGR
jgi:YVTN family beta-propeller protein